MQATSPELVPVQLLDNPLVNRCDFQEHQDSWFTVSCMGTPIVQLPVYSFESSNFLVVRPWESRVAIPLLASFW
jgi:hypothetical protein